MPESKKTAKSKTNDAPQKRTLTIDDYKFEVDTDLLDDVEAFEIIDRIENQVFGKHTRRVFTIWMIVFGLVWYFLW